MLVNHSLHIQETLTSISLGIHNVHTQSIIHERQAVGAHSHGREFQPKPKDYKTYIKIVGILAVKVRLARSFKFRYLEALS
jgi:hypothetical protein